MHVFDTHSAFDVIDIKVNIFFKLWIKYVDNDESYVKFDVKVCSKMANDNLKQNIHICNVIKCIKKVRWEC